MGLPTLNDNLVNIIRQLTDYPNQLDGLTGEELRKRFDQAAENIKNYINNELIPSLDAFVSESDTAHNDFAQGLKALSNQVTALKTAVSELSRYDTAFSEVMRIELTNVQSTISKLISDASVSSESTWSSEKIKEEIARGAGSDVDMEGRSIRNVGELRVKPKGNATIVGVNIGAKEYEQIGQNENAAVLEFSGDDTVPERVILRNVAPAKNDSDAVNKKQLEDTLAEKTGINDSVVGGGAWSSKNILDKFCPVFKEQGNPVLCDHPVAGVPLPVSIQLPADCDAEQVTLWYGGKNLLGREETSATTIPGSAKTKKGVRFVCRADGGFDVSGTPTENFVLQIGAITLPAGTYTVSFGGKHLNVYARIFQYVGGELVGEITDTSLCVGGSLMSQNFTLEQTSTLYAKMYLVKGRECNTIVYPMIEPGSVKTPYEPYSGGEFTTVDITDGPGVTYTVPLSPRDGGNYIYADAGTITVTGWTDPQYLRQRQDERIAALEAALIDSI